MKNVKNIKRNGGTSMNLKRITALLAALALAASMAACQKAQMCIRDRSIVGVEAKNKKSQVVSERKLRHDFMYGRREFYF